MTERNVLDVRVAGTTGALSIDVAFTARAAPLLLVGPNGAGKTTALMMILGAVAPARGRVSLGGTVLFDHEGKIDVPVEQREIAFVPQRYALFPHLDVAGNVGYGIRAASPAERARRARETLAELDVADLATRRPARLSGGEMQRIALARALACRPRALLMDEPLAALDVSVRRDVRRFLAERLRALAIPTVLVTHDAADAEALDGDVVVIESGTVVQRGRLADLAAAPATGFVRQFVSARTP